MKLESLSNPSPDQFNKMLRRKKPFIVTGLLDDWPALKKWSFEYFTEAAGDRVVRVTHSKEDVYDAPSYLNMTLREFIEIISSDVKGEGTHYITGIDLEKDLPEIAGDVKKLPVLADKPSPAGHFFFGRDTVTGCHYHPYHQNILLQLLGDKKVTLFSPKDFFRLYQKPWNSPLSNWSQIKDIRNYDRSEFPRFEKATPIEVTLKPGMALHIPIHWYHFVYGEGTSASQAFFWSAPFREYSFSYMGIRRLFMRIFKSKN